MSAVRKRKKGNEPKEGSFDDSEQEGGAKDSELEWTSPISVKDILIALGLFLASLAKALYEIEIPAEFVYDEIHFTKYSTYYLTGHFFVDIHPPLAKLLMYVAEVLNGYEHLNESNVQWWTHDGYVGTMDYLEVYKDKNLTYIALRKMSAFIGSVMIAAFYLTSRAMGCSRTAALFTASLGLFDNMIAIYSRVILMDIYLWTFHLCAIGASFMSAHPGLSSSAQAAWVVATGVFLGCACSVKYLAGGTVAIVGVHQLCNVIYQLQQDLGLGKPGWKKFLWNSIWKAITILGLCAAVFFGCWYIHVKLLPHSGGGEGFMPQSYQNTLTNRNGCPNRANATKDCGWWNITQKECEQKGCCWDPRSGANFCYPTTQQAPRNTQMGMVEKIEWNLRITWRNNQGDGMIYHPTMSRWYTWPFLLGRVVIMGGRGENSNIYSIGNPVVWWLVASTVILSGAGLLVDYLVSFQSLAKKKRAPTSTPAKLRQTSAQASYPLPTKVLLGILVTGYTGCLVPFCLVPRSQWNYHYALALVCAMLLTGLCADLLLKSPALKQELRYLLVGIVEMVIVAGFIYWAPWTYGFKLTPEQHEARKWNELWGSTGSVEDYGLDPKYGHM
eukprot:g29894.t1